MNVVVPDAPAAAANLSPEEARLRLAFAMYQAARLSTAQCAELAGLSRVGFLDELARHRVEAPYTVADLDQDLATLQKIGKL